MTLVTILVSFLASFLTCYIFIRWWRYQIRKSAEIDQLLQHLKTEISELITEINGTTDRNIALIESRIQAMKMVMDKASKIYNVLETENLKHTVSQQVYTELARNKPIVAESVPKEPDDVPDDPPAPLDLHDVGHEEQPPQTDQRAQSDLSSQIDMKNISLRDRVLVLHRQGESVDAIAKSIKMSRGEVQLLIDLHDRES